MRITQVGYALGVVAAVALFAGCSGNGSSMSPVAQMPGQGTQSVVRNHYPAVSVIRGVLNNIHPGMQYTGKNWAKPNVSGTLVYLCEFYGGFCNFYKSGSNVVMGTIAVSYPNGICTDKAGNVWIPDGGAQTISEYAKGGTTALTTLSDTGQQPSACAVDSNGTVYVGNIAAGTISVYKKGSTTITRTITVANAQANGAYVIGVSVDELHNLAVSWSNFSISGVDIFPKAKGTGTTKISSGTDAFGSVEFDNAENLILDDQTTASFSVYTPSWTSCNTVSNGSGVSAVSGALDKTNGDFVLANDSGGTGVELTYGGCTGGGTLEKTYSSGLVASGLVIGVAVDPGQGI